MALDFARALTAACVAATTPVAGALRTMRDQLTSKQRLFIEHYIAIGGRDAAKAATLAGYLKGAKVTAFRLLRNPLILQELRTLAERKLKSNVALGAAVLEDLARNAKNESVKLKAAEALLDRGGLMLATISRHEVTVTNSRTDKELLERVEQLTRELGLGAKVIDQPPPQIHPLPAISAMPGQVTDVELVDAVEVMDPLTDLNP
jgi:phage terminase small subunit